ncbi:MAG: hypothetical protein DCF16_10730 [Alphaproteobacteria bacterium]|nr:MAG: hypothetical protein DCF16_10730 [Alphaproteobacteria bacterium]
MKLKRGLSGFWAFLYRSKLARAPMPFWRVVVEAKLDRRVKAWPKRHDAAVVAIYVWARTIEEAEGLAVLAVEDDGLKAMTADALKCAPAAAPRQQPAAVARSAFGFLTSAEDETRAGGASRRDARA